MKNDPAWLSNASRTCAAEQAKWVAAKKALDNATKDAAEKMKSVSAVLCIAPLENKANTGLVIIPMLWAMAVSLTTL